MCRQEALKASSHIDEFKEAGATRVVGIVKEDLPGEVEEFQNKYWKGEVVMDKEQKFYEALGGGSHHKPFGLVSFLAMLANPWSSRRTKQNLSRVQSDKVENNMKGEGFVAGGCYVMRPDGSPAFSFLEEELGDYAEAKDIIDAIKEASKVKNAE
eukprot:TRINITY_DN40520_c0_g1_i1.p1 TRINITY_DN40520_c0_g1~~TRINITY_DN40520_c0_g1_i1.p1  ORF type:complete len:155 (-),score=43.99 TRINITY_DN40520_c0_g1_i1:41-505(-)